MKTSDASLLIVYKNFAGKNVSHIGLGVAALNNMKVLRSLGLKVDVRGCGNVAQLRENLYATPRSHVVISAPWIAAQDLQALAYRFSETKFYLNCHSNVGFLQADQNGTRLFREAIDLQIGTYNFFVAGNSRKFAEWVQACFGVDCAWLPNCYFLDSHTPTEHPYQEMPGVPLRIGVFGATRPLKNMMTAAGAALEMARTLRRPLDLWMSSGRIEQGSHHVVAAIQALFAELPGVTLHFNGWAAWPDFRRLIAQMHILLQPSYTESFNMVTADGVAMGVPSVTSDAIDWVPPYWRAHADNVVAVAETGLRVLHHKQAAMDGYTALVKHNTSGTRSWARELGLDDLPVYSSALAPHQWHRYETAA